MRFAISPLHFESFRDYAGRLKLSTDELIAKVFEAEENRIPSMLGIGEVVSFAPGDKTVQDFSDLTERAIAPEVQSALDVLEAIQAGGPPLYTGRMSQAETVEQLWGSLDQLLGELELNVVLGYGPSTTVSQTSFGSVKYSLYYDMQLMEAVKLVSLYSFFFSFDMKSAPARKRSPAETRTLVNSHPRSRWGAAAFIVGLVESYDREFDVIMGEYIDAGKNASAAFKFLFYHELAHHLLGCDHQVNDLDVRSTELACDEFASSIFARAIGGGQIDLVEACAGLTSLFFVQHMKAVYSGRDLEISGSYPKAIERLACIPSQWEDYDPSVLGFPFGEIWNTLDAALHDYASLCRSLHFVSGDSPLLFHGKYFTATRTRDRLFVSPHDLTVEEILKRNGR